MPQLKGKVGIVFGVANKNSIAWAIARAWHREGASLVFTYQNERFKKSIQELIDTLDSDHTALQCDVICDNEIKAVVQYVADNYEKCDMLLHSVAYAPREALDGEFINTTREGFNSALEISAYSLTALAQNFAPLMKDGGSIIAMSYYGAEKVIPHYNVMGVAKAALEASTRYLAYDLGTKKIRVNCISAGPVNTLAARGISDFHSMLDHCEAHSPLKRNVLPEEIGETAAFLASDGASGITGQVIYVDCGYNIMGM